MRSRWRAELWSSRHSVCGRCSHPTSLLAASLAPDLRRTRPLARYAPRRRATARRPPPAPPNTSSAQLSFSDGARDRHAQPASTRPPRARTDTAQRHPAPPRHPPKEEPQVRSSSSSPFPPSPLPRGRALTVYSCHRASAPLQIVFVGVAVRERPDLDDKGTEYAVSVSDGSGTVQVRALPLAPALQ